MRYILRRALFYLVAAFAAITFNFFLFRMMPGDPADIIFAQYQGRLDVRAMAALRASLGFVEGPLHEQYFTYLQNLFQGNMGISISNFPQPVIAVIPVGLAWTLRLVGTATVLSFGLGTLIGIFVAWRRGRLLDTFFVPFATMLGSFPVFWVALILLYFIGFQNGWLPMMHAFDIHMAVDWTNPTFLVSVVEHAIMPSLTIVLTTIGGWILGMRNNMIGVISSDYITLAKAKGLSDRRIMLTYAARNAMLPNLTGFAMSLGFVLGGALLVEIVFSYPGMGSLLLAAVLNRDYPLMQGALLMIIFSVLLANFLIDILYVVLDPRTR